MIRGIYSVETNELSFLFFLWYVRQNHGIECMINIKKGLQEKKMKYGAQHLSHFLQEQIEEKGGKVILNTKVIRVFQTQDYC